MEEDVGGNMRSVAQPAQAARFESV